MKRIKSNPAARTRKNLARSAVLLALALAAPASARTLAPGVLFEVSYTYDSLGRPASRTVNGELQVFEYDARDRLVAVRAEDGSDIERYRYDAAGNILEKTVRGETTRFVYDAANQLVSRTDGTGTTAFAYDAAGRLVREGNKRFVYGNDGHVSRVLEGGAVVASFDYFLDGQVAAVHARGRTERFLWDGLAMVARGDRTFLNEPAATGGNPVASMGRAFLNDMLGSTVGVHDRKARTRTAVSMTLFGETDADEAYFTGKPALPELGYAFLVRSYRADLGKWQTRDPLGYPDGWNAMAYCNGKNSYAIDVLGASAWLVVLDASTNPSSPSHVVWQELGGGQVPYLIDYDLTHSLTTVLSSSGPSKSITATITAKTELLSRRQNGAAQWSDWGSLGEASISISVTASIKTVDGHEGIDVIARVSAIEKNGGYEVEGGSFWNRIITAVSFPSDGIHTYRIGDSITIDYASEGAFQSVFAQIFSSLSISYGPFAVSISGATETTPSIHGHLNILSFEE